MRIFACGFLIAGCVFSLSAGPASIGIVRSYGEFRVDGAAVRGNSTLVAGDVVETMAMNTTINLGPTELTLLPESRAALYGNHTTLQRGTTLLRGASTHALEAGSLRVVPTSQHSMVEVGYNDRKLITVSAHAGAADVFSASGTLLASINPGGSLSFSPMAKGGALGSGQATATTAVTLEGKLTKHNGQYYMTSDGKSYEITSSTVNLDQYVGKVVTTTGSVASSTGGVTVVTASSVTVGAAVAGAGFATAATVAVVLGVAGAATVGGLAAAGTFSGASPSSSIP